ncbi:DUF3823 domain-containing protein [Leeuwenhoekiella sp. W20_SRS_FM14]|uniref:DUF3823 domain-containing protein n=1 Tax=Leeuwenhoekiella sp. W20_SRS_FM14 TaxID=3240270 RepID=UPI003F9E8C8A
MRTFQNISLKLCLILALGNGVVSCEYDNFDEPQTTIQGRIVDASGNLVPTQQPNGTRIRLYDQAFENVQPVAFWGMPDGTYKYSRIFSGSYKIIANGPFFPIDTLLTNIQDIKNLDIEVVPFLKVNDVNVEKKSNAIEVSFSISRTQEIGKINQIAVFVNTTPFVDSNNFINNNPETNVGDISDEELLSNIHQKVISDLELGEKYYIRAAARAANSGNYYNYSEMIEIEL